MRLIVEPLDKFWKANAVSREKRYLVKETIYLGLDCSLPNFPRADFLGRRGIKWERGKEKDECH